MHLTTSSFPVSPGKLISAGAPVVLPSDLDWTLLESSAPPDTFDGMRYFNLSHNEGHENSHIVANPIENLYLGYSSPGYLVSSRVHKLGCSRSQYQSVAAVDTDANT